MIYMWKCVSCANTTECIRSVADIDIPPSTCDHCMSHEFSQRIIPPRASDKVKQFILLGDHGWHDKEYTRYRSIK